MEKRKEELQEKLTCKQSHLNPQQLDAKNTKCEVNKTCKESKNGESKRNDKYASFKTCMI